MSTDDFHEQFSYFMKHMGITKSKELKPKIKKIKPKIIYSFPFKNHYFRLIDDRINCNNVSLKVTFPNKKNLIFTGVDNILSYLIEANVPLEQTLIIEKKLMEISI